MSPKSKKNDRCEELFTLLDFRPEIPNLVIPISTISICQNSWINQEKLRPKGLGFQGDGVHNQDRRTFMVRGCGRSDYVNIPGGGWGHFRLFRGYRLNLSQIRPKTRLVPNKSRKSQIRPLRRIVYTSRFSTGNPKSCNTHIYISMCQNS